MVAAKLGCNERMQQLEEVPAGALPSCEAQGARGGDLSVREQFAKSSKEERKVIFVSRSCLATAERELHVAMRATSERFTTATLVHLTSR